MVTKRPANPGYSVLRDDDGLLVYFTNYQLNNFAAASQHLNAQAEGIESFLEYCRKLASDYPTSMVVKSLKVIQLHA